jgi:hypothetical protein
MHKKIISKIRVETAKMFTESKDIHHYLDSLLTEINILKKTYKEFDKERRQIKEERFKSQLIQECMQWWEHRAKQDGTPSPRLDLYSHWLEAHTEEISHGS